jgi:hypothetical protein
MPISHRPACSSRRFAGLAACWGTDAVAAVMVSARVTGGWESIPCDVAIS